MAKNNKLMKGLILLFLWDHYFLEITDRNCFWLHGLSSSHRSTIILCSLSEDETISISDNLLFCIITNNIVFFLQKNPKCSESVGKVLATELGKSWYCRLFLFFFFKKKSKQTFIKQFSNTEFPQFLPSSTSWRYTRINNWNNYVLLIEL